jgi:hypothetical protein
MRAKAKEVSAKAKSIVEEVNRMTPEAQKKALEEVAQRPVNRADPPDVLAYLDS